MKKKLKRLCYLILIICCILGVHKGIQLVNYAIIDKNLEPILLVDPENDEIMWHYFQQERENEKILLPKDSRLDGSYYDLDRDKKRILMSIYDYSDKESWIVEYDYATNEIERLFTYEDMEGIQSGDIEELSFVLNSNSVSFVKGDAIYVWDCDQKQARKLYTFEERYFGMHGFAYQWKSNEEIYLVESDDLILYNIYTQEREVIVENIGKIYFDMSNDNAYIVWQKQWGDHREVILMDMQTKKQKKIHTAKSVDKVCVQFSPDNEYIFMKDWHPDSKSGIRYWYLYHMKGNRKLNLYVDYPQALIVGW